MESLLSASDEAHGFLGAEELKEHIGQLGSSHPGNESLTAVIGSTVGRYHVLSLLGAGAMGQVYRAYDASLGREVALKLLPPHLTDDEARVTRFQREARAASSLNHQNAVTIYEIGEAGGTWYIAAELIQGVTLRQRLTTGKLSLEDSVSIAMQGSAALWPFPSALT